MLYIVSNHIFVCFKDKSGKTKRSIRCRVWGKKKRNSIEIVKQPILNRKYSMSKVIASTYELIEKIGSGGGGNVYLAYHRRLGKKLC